MSEQIKKRVQAIGLIPVIKLQNIEDSEALAGALVAGGIPLAEVTFRAAGAEQVIARMRKCYPQMLVGAGTVLTTEQAGLAIHAGAQFIVAPGCDPKVIDYCRQKGILIVPGVSTASELGVAVEHGLEIVKFFPAEQSGGLAAIKALAGPFGGVKFIPTGGINTENLASYLSCDRVAACGGTFMVGAYLASGEWEKITALCRECVRLMHGFSIAHVGVNTKDEQEALSTANLFASLLGLPVKPGNSSIFVDAAIEVMKAPYLGAHGHIGMKTNNLVRAVAYLEEMGIAFNKETMKYNKKGTPSAVYFEQEVAGFAVHLVQA